MMKEDVEGSVWLNMSMKVGGKIAECGEEGEGCGMLGIG